MHGWPGRCPDCTSADHATVGDPSTPPVLPPPAPAESLAILTTFSGDDSSRGLPPTRAALVTESNKGMTRSGPAPLSAVTRGSSNGSSDSPMSSPEKVARTAPLELGL